MSASGHGRGAALRLTRWVLAFVVIAVLLPYLITPLYLVARPVSTLMMWRWVTGARVERTWVPLEAMAAPLPLAVVAAEDARFCSHAGIDWQEIHDAIEDAGEGGRLRGGSTITQQTAKNLFLWPQPSLMRKGLEFPLALWIELVLPKRRILEIYLNVAEWGPNGEFGAEAGARRAFGKSVRELNAREAALMAAVLPNPLQRNAKRPGPGVLRLSGIYQVRARATGGLDACFRRP